MQSHIAMARLNRLEEMPHFEPIRNPRRPRQGRQPLHAVKHLSPVREQSGFFNKDALMHANERMVRIGQELASPLKMAGGAKSQGPTDAGQVLKLLARLDERAIPKDRHTAVVLHMRFIEKVALDDLLLMRQLRANGAEFDWQLLENELLLDHPTPQRVAAELFSRVKNTGALAELSFLTRADLRYGIRQKLERLGERETALDNQYVMHRFRPNGVELPFPDRPLSLEGVAPRPEVQTMRARHLFELRLR